MGRQTLEYLQNWPEIQYIGTQLKAVREERDMSQVQFAQFLGVPQSYVSSWERGAVSPYYLQLLRIAAKCEKEVSFFILVRPWKEVLKTPDPPKD